MFGPSRKEVWQQLSREMNARFVEGGFTKADKVQVTHGEWTVTLDTYAVTTGKVVIVFTRMATERGRTSSGLPAGMR